nr:penicillin-insensitive murein endopeptidase [Chromatium okenii]
MSSSHRSHQNGLDVDLWFTLATSPAAARALMDHADDPPSMVRRDGLAVSEYWGADQQFLIETAARQRTVERIFVNPAIKQALCQHAMPNDRSWLHKVRPWKGHDAHFHVRLVCPPGSPHCEHKTHYRPATAAAQSWIGGLPRKHANPNRGFPVTRHRNRRPARCLS